MFKQLYIILIALCLSSHLVSAQGRGEKVESLKVAFIAEKLNLDSKTAEKFWPIYNEYEDEMRALIQQKKQVQKDQRSVDDILDQEQKALDIKKKYATQFSKLLSPDQVNQLFRAEKEFRQMLMRRANPNR